MVRLQMVASLALLLGTSGDVIFKVPEVLTMMWNTLTLKVRHAATSKPVGTGPANGSRVSEPQEPQHWSEPQLEVRYEEYFVEHDVSTAAARTAAKALNLDEVPATREGCGVCSRKDLEYCETRVLADHCCCERRFFPEPFPWLPHTCYLGPHRCRPLARDCAQYSRLRDCCCYKKLAERWKGILSKSTRVGVSGLSLLLLSMLLFVAYL